MSDNETTPPAHDLLEFRFRWEKSEHRRFYRALQVEARRRSKMRWLLNLWFGLIALVGISALLSAKDLTSMGSAMVPLAIVGSWFAFDRWGLAYLSARSYERDHAPCIPNDQIRVLHGDGIVAQCTTSNASVRWTGIIAVRETPEFFLFFTTPNCAIQLPKRAVADLEQLRKRIKHLTESHGLANRSLQPTAAGKP